MPLIEVDESELQGHKQVTALVNQLLANPAARRKLQEAQKIVQPDVVIPEIDAAKPVLDEMDTLRKEMREYMAKLDEDREEQKKQATLRDLQSKWEKGRSSLRAGGYTDEGLAEVEKFMEEKGIADHDVGAAAFERLHPAPEPVRGYADNRFDLFSQEDRSGEHIKKLMENPDDPMALDALVRESLTNVRGR